MHISGISILSELAGEYHLKVTGEAQANALLGTLIQAGITIVTFNPVSYTHLDVYKRQYQSR